MARRSSGPAARARPGPGRTPRHRLTAGTGHTPTRQRGPRLDGGGDEAAEAVCLKASGQASTTMAAREAPRSWAGLPVLERAATGRVNDSGRLRPHRRLQPGAPVLRPGRARESPFPSGSAGGPRGRLAPHARRHRGHVGVVRHDRGRPPRDGRRDDGGRRVAAHHGAARPGHLPHGL